MLVPKVEEVFIMPSNLQRWQEKALTTFSALSAGEVDHLIETQETGLIQAATTAIDARQADIFAHPAEKVLTQQKTASQGAPLWGNWRTGGGRDASVVKTPTPRRRSGPAPDTESHLEVANIVRPYGKAWDTEDNLLEVCQALDDMAVPVPAKWWKRQDVKAQTWKTALRNNPRVVKRAIRYHLRAVGES